MTLSARTPERIGDPLSTDVISHWHNSDGACDVSAAERRRNDCSQTERANQREENLTTAKTRPAILRLNVWRDSLDLVGDDSAVDQVVDADDGDPDFTIRSRLNDAVRDTPLIDKTAEWNRGPILRVHSPPDRDSP